MHLQYTLIEKQMRSDNLFHKQGGKYHILMCLTYASFIHEGFPAFIVQCAFVHYTWAANGV